MAFYEVLKFSHYLSPTLLLIGILICLAKRKHINGIHKSLGIYMFLMLCSDVASRIIVNFYSNNLIILPVYSLIELVFFLFFYRIYLFKVRQNILIGIGLIGIVYIIGEILFYFIFNTLDSKVYQPYAKVVDNFIIIMLSLTFFQEKMNRFRESKWENVTLNLVIITFFTLNLIFFLPFNFLINESTGLKFYFWLGNLTITVLFYLYLTWSIWKNGRTQRS